METPMRVILLALLPLLVAPQSGQAQSVLFDGKPAFSEGADLGYYLWKDRDGDTWHVRWTTKGQMRHFAGSVYAEGEGATLKSLKRIDVENERRVLYPGRAPHLVVGPRGNARVRHGRAPVVVSREQDKIEKDGDDRIVFSARTDDDIDGFDFRPDEKVQALRFILDIDGKPFANLVEIGSNNVKAKSLPLIIRLR
jgi:hypothetical protein